MDTISDLISHVRQGDFKSIARAVTIVENELEGYSDILLALDQHTKVPVIGMTGPPGAGKSTLINALIGYFLEKKKRIAVIAVDPTSPFNYGSLLGDRLRMSAYFNHPDVFIRSLATRGSLGGLSEKIIEVTDVLRQANFDYIFVETVGVGQSEVEIAGLADITLLVFVPESGDDVQAMKSGIIEIADIFIVNKRDREGADRFAANLQQLMQNNPQKARQVPVFRTSAVNREGIAEVGEALEASASAGLSSEKKIFLLTEKAFRLLQRERMKGISRSGIQEEIRLHGQEPGFSIYKLAKSFSGKP